jgi:hypothetical protein
VKTASVADILERERDSTIKRWLKQVNSVAGLINILLSDANRMGHLPKLFDDLLSRLRRGRDAQSIISIAAAVHGNERFEQGYSPALLVEESRLFQVSAFRTLHLNQSELDHSKVLLDVMTIADEADSQLTETMRGFMVALAAA